MTLDALVRAYRDATLTSHELFAALTSLLAARPDELAASRAALSFDERLQSSFEDWLEGLKSYPIVQLGNKPVPVTRALVSRLGAPRMPAPRRDPATGALTLKVARIAFTAPPGERPVGVFAAQLKTRQDGATIPYGRHRVVVQPLALLDHENADSEVAAIIAPSSNETPESALQGEVELFQGTTQIATGSVTPSRSVPRERRERRLDTDFLSSAVP